MKIKILLLLALMLTCTLTLQAQNREVTGKVVDQNGNPLPYVSVSIKGTNKAAITADDGTYRISVAPKEQLVFSMVGYEKQTVRTGTKSVINITLLESDDMKMTDLVVVGYSRQERRDLTGSVSSVTPKDNVAFESLDKMLQGRVPGLYMSNSSGALGAANVLTIRGISSIMGDNNPLYVIDGVPMFGTDRNANSVGTTGGSIPGIAMGGMQTGGGTLKYNIDLNNSFEKNPLANINPDDIESIEILKDAFATAIYGSRGAAGVILITTKKGARGRTKVNVGYSLSIDNPIGKLDLLNGDQYSQFYSLYYPKGKYPAGYNTDWIDAVTRTAVSHGADASISGGSDNTDYFLSVSYDNNQSYIINNDMSSMSARLNLNTKLAPKWMAGVSVSLNQLSNNALAANSIYSAATRKASNLPIYDDATGDYYYGYGLNSKGTADAYNPVAMAYINDEYSEDTRIFGNAYLEWRPLNWLQLRSEVGTDIYNTFSNIRKGELPEYLTGVVGNQAQETTKNSYKVVVNNLLTINKTFAEDHFFQGILGQSYEYTKERINSVAGSNFFSPDLVGVGAAQTKRVTAAYMQRYALFSAFARLNYQYKHTYMLGLTYRLDGSSRFNRNHRYLSTPSVSFGWRMSNESFIKDNLPFVNEMKLRGSVGLSSKDGNNSYYGAQAVYKLNTLTTYGGKNYLQMSQPGNENLKWEKTITYDAGFDLEMFKSRVKLTIDYYYKKTTNMLFSSDLPYYTGYSKENQNIADMSNQGIDFQLITDNIMTPDFQWQSIINISRATNKILKLNFEGNQLDQANSSYKYYEEGKPVAQWYLHKWVGVDPLTGDPLWEYKDGTISSTPPAADYANSQNNKFVCGVALPDFYGSFTNTLTYKNFELDFMFNFSVGSRMINSTKATLLNYTGEDANNLSTDILNMWQMPGQVTDIPKLNNASIIGNYDYTTAVTTTRFLENNSYLRLKYISLTYNVPRKVLRHTRLLNQLKIHATVTNLFTITKYTGLDPEVSAFGSSALNAGYDNMTMPQSRSIQFGVKASF